MDRIIAIGDIHGEIKKLEILFEKLINNHNLSKDDQIIFLGDYIDRGYCSREVIDFIINLKKSYNVVCLKGNHEEFATYALQNPNSNMAHSWLMNGGMATLKNYNLDIEQMFDVHGEFFKDLKTIHETENHIFVHGYLNSSQDVENQDVHMCLWGRFDDIKPHKSNKTVVVGHTIQEWEPLDLGYKICIDTGSFCTDGCITALLIDGNKKGFVSSKSFFKNY